MDTLVLLSSAVAVVLVAVGIIVILFPPEEL